MDSLEQVLFVASYGLLAVFALSLVYLWGKRDRVSGRILTWMKEGAIRQIETPCTVFRHGMALIGIAAAAMAYLRAADIDPENWTKLIFLSGIVGTVLAAAFHQGLKSLFRRSDTRILEANTEGAVSQTGVNAVVALHDTAEFQNPDSRVVFTDRHLNPVQG